MKTDLSHYNNSWYQSGTKLRRFAWYVVEAIFFRSAFPFSGIKVRLLRLFGATVGEGVVIKPHVAIKYPWFLSIGNHSWVGEQVWIDNLADVVIGSHVCLSQGALLLTGNHNYKKPGFDLMVSGIVLEDGVWIGAKAVVCPGVTCYSHAVLTVGSVATANLNAYIVYSGNPAHKQRHRLASSIISNTP